MNFDALLSKVLSNPALSGVGGGLLAGGLVSALGNKGGRRLLSGATKLGAAAAVGALAVEAIRRYRSKTENENAPTPNILIGAGGSPTLAPAVERMAIAMLSAARADGELDDDERIRIKEKLAALDVDAETQAYALTAFDQPADPHRVAKLATDETAAAEIYLVSLCAIKTDHWAETAYLRELQNALGLPQALIDELTASVSATAGVNP